MSHRDQTGSGPPDHEVDQSLVADYRAMTLLERLRAATRHAATLERLRRAASAARGYDELVAHSLELADGDLRVRVIDLPTLIAIKESTGRDKDRLVVSILRALRDPQ